MKQAEVAAAALGDSIITDFPFAGGMGPVSKDLTELILNRDWRPALSIIGVEGLPAIGSAGNVLRPMTALKLSLRLPPTCDPKAANQKLQSLLEADPLEMRIVTTSCGSRVERIDDQRLQELLAELESYGVHHDDQDPRNVTYRQSDGRFCLVDFELATILSDKTPKHQQ